MPTPEPRPITQLPVATTLSRQDVVVMVADPTGAAVTKQTTLGLLFSQFVATSSNFGSVLVNTPDPFGAPVVYRKSEVDSLLDTKEPTITILGVAKGGTGLSSIAEGSLLVGSGAQALEALALGSENQLLTVQSGRLAWSSFSLGIATVTVSGTVKTDSTSSDPVVYLKASVDNLLNAKQALITVLDVEHGGTGRDTLVAGALLVGNGTNGVTSLLPGTAGQSVISDGTNWTPGSIAAAFVGFTSAGTGLTAATVQDALGELATTKANLSSPDFTGTPTAPTPASNDTSQKLANTAFVRGLVDAEATVRTQADAALLPKAGGTMSGLLTLSGAPTTGLHAATKAYVDSVASGGGGSAITVKDEGASLTAAATSLDFVGAGVTATQSGGLVTVTIPGGGAIPGAPTITSMPTAQATGAALTITGTNFYTIEGKPFYVYFAGLTTPRVAYASSPTTLQVEAPSGTSPGPIRIVTPFGEVTSSVSITIANAFSAPDSGNLAIWYAPDSLTIANGLVTGWGNKSVVNNPATNPGTPPTAFPNDLNGYTTVGTPNGTVDTAGAVTPGPAYLSFNSVAVGTLIAVYKRTGTNLSNIVANGGLDWTRNDSNSIGSGYSAAVNNAATRVNGGAPQPASATPQPTEYSVISTYPGGTSASRLFYERIYHHWIGRLAEIFIWTSALNSQDLATVENYLAAKYNINGSGGVTTFLTASSPSTILATQDYAQSIIPSQAGQTGKVLGTNGTVASWVQAGGSTIDTASITTSSLANGATQTGTVALAKTFIFVGQITTSVPARVRLYTSAASRDADLTRPIGTAPTNPAPVLLELITSTGALTYDLNGTGSSSEDSSLIAYSVTNLSGTSSVVTATLKFVKGVS